MSERAPPVIFMFYARPWFFDPKNHLRVSRILLDMADPSRVLSQSLFDPTQTPYVYCSARGHIDF